MLMALTRNTGCYRHNGISISSFIYLLIYLFTQDITPLLYQLGLRVCFLQAPKTLLGGSLIPTNWRLSENSLIQSK